LDLRGKKKTDMKLSGWVYSRRARWTAYSMHGGGEKLIPPSKAFFLICIVGVESKLGPLGTSTTYWAIVPAPGDCEDGEICGMNGRGNRSTRRKPAPAPLCPPQIPLDQTWDGTRAAAVGSQRLTASAMSRPTLKLSSYCMYHLL
jgi:hypothetical protein